MNIKEGVNEAFDCRRADYGKFCADLLLNVDWNEKFMNRTVDALMEYGRSLLVWWMAWKKSMYMGTSWKKCDPLVFF